MATRSHYTFERFDSNCHLPSFVQEQQFKRALRCLREAEQLTNTRLIPLAGDTQAARECRALRATTFNNIGVLFKHQGRLRKAWHWVSKALKLEEAPSATTAATMSAGSGSSGSGGNPAGTHLNMSAVLSQMGRHSSALHHADAAVNLLTADIKWLKRQQAAGSSHQQQEQWQQRQKSTHSLLAVAYHNMAVEQEHLKKFRAASQSYRRAEDWAQAHLGMCPLGRVSVDFNRLLPLFQSFY